MVACIVDDWMDRQTNYIVNNLTNMQIGVYLPDFSQLGEGFSTIKQQITNTRKDPKSFVFGGPAPSFTQSTKQSSANDKAYSGNFISQLRNETISK